jgi:hypothetical protein
MSLHEPPLKDVESFVTMLFLSRSKLIDGQEPSRPETEPLADVDDGGGSGGGGDGGGGEGGGAGVGDGDGDGEGDGDGDGDGGAGDGDGEGDGAAGGGAASCDTMYGCPPSKACATRCGPVLAATFSPMVALAFPVALLVIVSQPLSLDVDHPQPVSVVSVTASVPPAQPDETDVLLSA